MAFTLLDRLLASRHPLTPATLAAHLGDTVPRAARSVQRYLARFAALGLRYETSARGRGITVPQTMRAALHLLDFTEDELTALYFHLAVSRDMLEGSPLQAHLTTVGHKIGASVTALYNLPALQHAFGSWQKWYKTYSTPAVQATLAPVLRALQETKVCQLTYRTLQATSDWGIRIHPYALFAYEGGLYLFAYLPDDERLVVLSIERMRSIHVLEEVSFEKSPQILAQIAVKRARAFGIIDDEDALEVVLKFTAEQAPYVRERVWHPSQVLEDQADGTLLLRLCASGQFEIVRWVLGWGEDVEVLAPPALRAAVIQHLQAAAQYYPAEGSPP